MYPISHDEQSSYSPTIAGERILDRAETALENTSSPFFFWTHLMDLHGPLHPDTVRKGGLCTASPRTQFSWDADRMADIEEPRCELRYDSALRYVDSQIERFVGHLRSEGLWDDTSLVVTGDHGEALHDRGQYGHPHHYLYDDLLHVPLVVRDPTDEKQPSRTDRPFSLAWTHQLLSALAGVSEASLPESGDDGPFERVEVEALVSDSISPKRHSIAARENGYKTIIHSDSGSEIDFEGQLFETIVDRGERRNLAGEYPSHWLKERADELTVAPSSLHELGAEMSEDVEDRLKELGYMS